MPRRSTSLVAGAVLAALPLLAGCNGKELEELRTKSARLEQEGAAQRAEVERLSAELTGARTERDAASATLKTTETDLAAARGELDAARAREGQLSEELGTARTDSASARAAAEQAKSDAETAEKERGKLASHRDELIEWVNELLPLAEQQDERLRNLRAITDDIARQVERYRGLEFKRPFMRRLIHREDVVKFMRRDMERDMPREEARKLVLVMSEFGLVAPDADFYAMFEGFMEAGAAAFYKPDTQTFYLIEGKNDRGDRPIVFHELVHALEDQHFGLDGLMQREDQDSDAGMAVKALVEGSAEHFTNAYSAANPDDLKAMMAAQMTPDMVQRQAAMMQTVPMFLIASMGLYPYKNGAAWLDAIGARDGAAVDRIYADLPASSEQVLHPEKWGKDFPRRVGAPDLAGALGSGWEILDDDTLGELFCGLVVATNRWNPTLRNNLQALLAVLDMTTQGVGFKPPIAGVVEGWDGDRYSAAVSADSARVCVAWASVWDSAQDAQEFAAYYATLVGARAVGKKSPLKDVTLPARFERPSDGAVFAVEVQGDRVFVVLGAPAEQADAVLAATRAVPVTADPRDAADAAK